MAWFDIGVNLLDERFDFLEVIQESKKEGVDHILVISSTISEALQSQIKIAELKQSHVAEKSSKLSFTAGIHPHYADHAAGSDWCHLRDLLLARHPTAVGECGLDFNRKFSTPENQLKVFEKQLRLASDLGYGVYLHERDAFEPQVALLKKYRDNLPFAVAHCFTGNAFQVDTYLQMGCHIVLTGWLCDEKRGRDLRDAVKSIPLDKMLLETDSPYLFPKTLRPRQKNNKPMFIKEVAKELSLITEFSVEEIEHATFDNASKLFS